MGCFIPLRINRPNIEVFRNPQDVPALKKYALLEILIGVTQLGVIISFLTTFSLSELI